MAGAQQSPSEEGTINRVDPIYLQVYEYLRKAISLGDFAPGQRLVESQLAAKLRISRAPIREAMRKLEQDGLVHSVPGKGCIVYRPSLDDIRDVYTCRAALEGLAVLLAARLPDRSFVAQLQEILDKNEAAMARGDVEQVLRLNNEYHNTIIRATGNRLLFELVNSLWDRILFYRTMAIREVPRTSEISQQSHRRIVECIARGEAELGRQVAEESVFRVYDLLVEHLKVKGLP